MNVLITGATGFIGSHLLEAIINEGQTDYNIILLTSRIIEGYRCIIHKNYTFTKQDFLDNNIEKIDVVIHVGAFTPKCGKETNDIEKSFSNITNTKYMIENMPNVPQKFIFCSTLDIYGKPNGVVDEETLEKPVGLYGHSKLFCEKLLLEWAKQNGVILQILRLGHIYGPGENEYKKIIPLTIKNVLKDKSPSIYSNGLEVRAFLYIKDCCKTIVKSIKLDHYIGPVNIVSKHSITILELVNEIISISGKDLVPTMLNTDMTTFNLTFNNDKMKKYFGEEEVPFKEGIRKEYEYFRKNRY